MYSISFDGNDLGAYGLSVKTKIVHTITHTTEPVRLQYRAFAPASRRDGKTLSFEVNVLGTSPADLIFRLDAIKRILAHTGDKDLAIDAIPGRFWHARFLTFDGAALTDNDFTGNISFYAADPLAYDVTPTNRNYPITASPTTIYEATSGSAFVRPVLTLTSGTTISGATVTVASGTTSQTLTWTGTLPANTPLVIDSERWVVTLGGQTSMTYVSGDFITLAPSTLNDITISGAGSNTTLNILYRNAYL